LPRSVRFRHSALAAVGFVGVAFTFTGVTMSMLAPNSNPTGLEETALRPSRGNLWGGLLSVAMLGAVFWPIQQNWRAVPKDSFPLSYYPMFSQKRELIESFYYLVGRDAQGARYYIPRRWIGTGGQNQVRKQMRGIIENGRVPELARSVARRLAGQNEKPWSQIQSVSVVSGQYVMNDFFHGKKEPVSEKILGSHRVKRKKT